MIWRKMVELKDNMYGHDMDESTEMLKEWIMDENDIENEQSLREGP